MILKGNKGNKNMIKYHKNCQLSVFLNAVIINYHNMFT